jgi:peptidyl-prolyl cis-trans isomerase SurA
MIPVLREQAVTRSVRFLLPLLASLLVSLATALSTAASAQQVVVLVNGEPITAIDVAQRTRLLQMSSPRTPSRQEVVEELIDEKLKLQIAKRYRIEVSEAEINSALAAIASRVRANPQQFAQSLAQAGINVESLKTRIKADIAWGQLIRGRFQSSLQIREKDIAAALESRKKDEKAIIGYEYSLRPILFIVPRGSPEAAYAARRKEAESLRARFQGCEEGVALTRGMRDVAVRNPIIRSSADLPPPLRAILDGTPVGKLTPPEVTPQGIEFFAVCSKKETSTDAPARREIRDEMLQQRFQAQAKRYLQELRRSAMIEYR